MYMTTGKSLLGFKRWRFKSNQNDSGPKSAGVV